MKPFSWLLLFLLVLSSEEAAPQRDHVDPSRDVGAEIRHKSSKRSNSNNIKASAPVAEYAKHRPTGEDARAPVSPSGPAPPTTQESGDTAISIPVTGHATDPSQMPVAAPSALPLNTPAPVTVVDEALVAVLQQHLEGLGTYDKSVLFDPFSYQYQALLQTSSHEEFSTFSQSTFLRYWALYCIYFATNQPLDNIFVDQTVIDGMTSDSRSATTHLTTPMWKRFDGWLSTNVDPCDWYGIRCDGVDRVVEIRLQRNKLTGQFPPEVAFLGTGSKSSGAGALRRLDLFRNPQLTHSSLDPSHRWIKDLGVSLEFLSYAYTAIGGPLPESFPSRLLELDIRHCLHNGPIAKSTFGGLARLKTLLLDGVNVNSSLPLAQGNGNLPSLQFFSARDASLTGDLSFLKSTPSIVEISVDSNPGLTGPLFSFIGELAALRSFSAADCGLSGTLPKELGNLSRLTQLWLYGNKLSGAIPADWSGLQDLKILALEDTDLRGTVPIDICLDRLDGALSTLSVDCDEEVDCSAFFPTCCTCCGRDACGS